MAYIRKRGASWS